MASNPAHLPAAPKRNRPPAAVLPFTGMHYNFTMYQAELKGPKGEVRALHINPWGQVMPFGVYGPRAGTE